MWVPSVIMFHSSFPFSSQITRILLLRQVTPRLCSRSRPHASAPAPPPAPPLRRPPPRLRSCSPHPRLSSGGRLCASTPAAPHLRLYSGGGPRASAPVAAPPAPPPSRPTSSPRAPFVGFRGGGRWTRCGCRLRELRGGARPPRPHEACDAWGEGAGRLPGAGRGRAGGIASSKRSTYLASGDEFLASAMDGGGG
jgi:hypothetical protein